MSHRAITMLMASLLTAAFGISSVQPARADGAAAVAAGIIISQNVAHKRELAGTVAGYTSDGATVYADGRVAYANGASYYPGDRGQQIACIRPTRGAAVIIRTVRTRPRTTRITKRTECTSMSITSIMTRCATGRIIRAGRS
jgi:hypothetical protein